MGLFKRIAGLVGAVLQRNGVTVADIERFGRHMYDPDESPWPSVWADLVGPMYYAYRADQDIFLMTLAVVAEQYGGWVSYGAERLMIEVAGGDLEHPAYGRIMNASLGFLRACGVPPMKVTGYEWQGWLASGGTSETWVPRRPTPPRAQAPISDISIGETRRLAQLAVGSCSNVFLVHRASEGHYRWIIDAPQSDDDPRRTQQVHVVAESLHDLYVRIGLWLQVPPYWHDQELEPYIPLPKPRF